MRRRKTHTQDHTAKIERFTGDIDLPVAERDYMFMKEIVDSDGTKLLSMYVTSFGYGIFTAAGEKGAHVLQ